MNIKDIILSIIELIACAGVIVAAFNEYKIAEHEKKLFKKIKHFLEAIR